MESLFKMVFILDGIGLNDVTYQNATTTGSRGLGLQ